MKSGEREKDLRRCYLSICSSPEVPRHHCLFWYELPLFDNHCDNWNELNSVAWRYFEKEEDKGKLEQALGWAKRSTEIEKNWYNTDTYANHLAKLGRTEEAIDIAKDAIKAGQDAGEDTKETEELLRSLEGEL